MKSFLNNTMAIERLKKEYQEHSNLIIGFDFDSTVYDYHKQGLNLEPVIKLLKVCDELGFTMCLHTVTPNEAPLDVEKKMEWCKNELGINVDFVNTSPVFPPHAQVKSALTKPFYSILLDDRAGLASAYEILLTTLVDLKLY